MLNRFGVSLISLALVAGTSLAMAAKYKNADGMSASDIEDCEAELSMMEGKAFKESVEECLAALKEAEGDVNATGRAH